MSGGVLVVVDRAGRGTRRFVLTHGLATIGRDPDNDIRITLPAVAPHHATVLIHDAQAVIRSTGGGVTLVNGRAVSVAPLRHGDVISVGGRSLRWEYSHPRATHNTLPSPVLEAGAAARRGRGRERERRSAPAAAAPRDRAVQLALELAHRASMPGSTGGKQVAVVQPQRRDAGENTEKSPARASPSTTRRSNYEPSTSAETEDKSKRKTRTSPKNILQSTTKATLWIESRKSTPRRKVQPPAQLPPSRRSLPNKKSTPLRMTVLKKAQSAHRNRVIKIEAPSKIDHTKQAAIMLMTGHTPKLRLIIEAKTKSSSKKSPSFLVKKPSPVRTTPRGNSGRLGRGSKSTGSDIGVTPSRGSDFAQQSAGRKSSKRYTSDRSVSVLEITDSTQNSTRSSRSALSERSPRRSISLPSPKKSAMKDRTKKSLRKAESITFDLSNLEKNKESNVTATDTTRYESDGSEDITLRYSESSAHTQSPSPRRSIHSRSGRLLEHAGTSLTPAPASPARSLSSDSHLARRSLRGNAMIQRALETGRTRSDLSVNSVDSDRTRSDLSDTLPAERTRLRQSGSTTASDRTISDISAILAAERTRSRLSGNTTAFDRTRSRLSANTTAFDRTRSDLSANLNDRDRTKSRLSANASLASAFRTRTISPRHNLESYSVVDLVSFDSEDATKSVYDSADSTNISEFGTPAGGGRRTRSAVDPVLLGSSTPFPGPNRARETRSKSSSTTARHERTSAVSTRRSKSLTTPENGQPAVVTRAPRPSRSRSRIHDDMSLLDSTEAEDSSPRTSRRSRTTVSETIDISNVDLGDRTEFEGTITPENRKSPEVAGTPVLSIRSLLDSSRGSVASASRERERAGAGAGAARRSRLQLGREPAASDDEGLVTPTNVTTLSPVSVKNKHSTAKKPQSKRSIIDDLNDSDIVKQLFKSPVKRKLTQSMSEFSRKRLFEDEDERPKGRRPTRRTLAGAPSAPALVDSSDTRAGGDSRGATRKRKSVKNDLTDVGGVKAVFGKAPKDDLRRVTGVRALFRQTSPRNDLTDVRGVRKMFQKKSPANDLRNVSGVKRVLATSPRNDLSDVRGVRKMFKGKKREQSYQDVSGIEELFQSRDRSVDRSEVMFDELVGRPPIRAVYSRTFPGRKAERPKRRRRSLRASVDVNNVEEWLEKELQRHLPSSEPSTSKRLTSEMKRLATDTVGDGPILARRTRNKSLKSGGSAGARAVHSTPLKGRLQLTMNASELGRVSPIAGPSADYPLVDRDCYVFLSEQTMEAVKNAARAQARQKSPRKQKSPKKVELSKVKEKSPEKSTTRTTRNKKVTETAAANTKRGRSSLVVTKKAPVMSPKLTSADSRNSVQSGTLRTRARAAKTALVVAKPSPKLKPRRAAKAESSQPEQVQPKETRKDTKKKPESPKTSPKGKRQTRTVASKNEPQTKGGKTEVEELAPIKAAPQSKRTRKNNAAVSNVGEISKTQDSVTKTRRGAAAKPEVEKKQTNSRGKTVQKETSVQSETTEKRSNTRGRKVQSQTVVEPEIKEKRTTARGKKTQTQASVQSETEEKKSNTRGKKVQFELSPQSEPTTRRGRTTKQEQNESKTRGNKTQSPPSEQSQPAARGRRAKVEVSIIETRRGKRKAANDDLSDVVPEPKKGRMTRTPAKSVSKDNKVETNKQETAKSVKTTRSKPIEEPVKKETRARGRKAAEPKEKAAASTRGKRKANVDPSPAKTAAKKSAPEPAPRARRAARAAPLPEAPAKAVRGRKR